MLVDNGQIKALFYVMPKLGKTLNRYIDELNPGEKYSRII
jgi:hypothetical protein